MVVYFLIWLYVGLITVFGAHIYLIWSIYCMQCPQDTGVNSYHFYIYSVQHMHIMIECVEHSSIYAILDTVLTCAMKHERDDVVHHIIMFMQELL